MSKVKPEIDNPLIPSWSPVARACETYLIFSVAAAGLAAAVIALARVCA